jgi:phenylpropionate dioxygenase-like ring-hydroxylating dioxygenase large terminal subunit
VDDEFLARFWERSRYEASRSGPPEGFPRLRDLPLGRYTDATFQALEDQYLFKRVWLYAAHDSELPDPGSYKLCDVAGAPILLARGEDGHVRGFYNACRHRGAPVVRGECGSARQLTCQFHSWTYNLSGELVRVPDERDFVDLDRSERGLPPVRCEQWGGWHFVNLDPDAEPLLDYLHPIPTLLPEVAAAPFRVIDVKKVELRCNWKILAEAFLEVYHARTIHPKTVGPSLDTRGTVITLYDHGHQSMLSPVNRGTRQDNRELLPMFEGATAIFRDGNVQPAHGIFPNLITPLDARGFPFLLFWPLAIDRTRLDITWFAADWGEGEWPTEQADIWQHRLKRFDVVMDEDYENLEPIQRSMESAAHGGQAINYQERRIWHVQAWIDKVIGPERIPEHLRVPDLLAGWVEPVERPV